jgi:hypothetical protein
MALNAFIATSHFYGEKSDRKIYFCSNVRRDYFCGEKKYRRKRFTKKTLPLENDGHWIYRTPLRVL